MPGIPTPREAEQVAHRLLVGLGDRWQHTQRVAEKAADLADAVPDTDRRLLIAAAWWHDLGYSPELRATGLHQLDGARYLLDEILHRYAPDSVVARAMTRAQPAIEAAISQTRTRLGH